MTIEPLSFEMLQRYKDTEQERHEQDREEAKQFEKYNQEQINKAVEEVNKMEK